MIRIPKPADETKRSWWRGFLAGALLCLVFFIVFCYVVQPGAITIWKSGGLSPGEASQVVSKIDLLLHSIEDNYLEEVDTDTLLDGAYHGLVSAMGDQYSRYYTEEEYEQYQQSSSGQYVGIGVTVKKAEGGGAEITEVAEGGPAEEAGIIDGDILIRADDTDLTSMELTDIVEVIQGPEGSEVAITYRRGEQENTTAVVRATIDEQTVSGEMLESGIGYIRIEGFEGVTTEQFKTALQSLQEQGLEGLIVDLRDNPGGRVDVVQEVTNELVPAGIITYTEDKYGNRQVYDATEEPFLDLPLVVLVNENSASAAEIMAGAIQDREVGILVGTTTFGKGIVQKTMPFTDGTAVKVTMAKYYTPNGNYIHGIGITPDIVIELPDGKSLADLTSRDEDLQLQAALEALKTEMGR